VIQVSGVTKRYGSVVALRDLSLTVPAGSIFGLLGPNGAGKTTLLRLMAGFLFPDQGQIEINGCSSSQLGYLPERPHFPRRFSIAEYLNIVGTLSGLPRSQVREAAAAVLQQTGLSQVADWKVAACSRGMVQRLAVAQALLTDPPLFLMDEPFEGLDPTAQAVMRRLILDLRQHGKTILLSTHRLADVTQICSDIAILSHGQLARRGPLHDVLAPRAQQVIRVDRLPEGLAWELRQLHEGIEIIGTEITLPGEAMEVKADVLRLLLDAQVDIVHVERQRATLEEVYLEAVRFTAGVEATS
jgi:ABC-2 type transport system ATP-binding protein